MENKMTHNLIVSVVHFLADIMKSCQQILNLFELGLETQCAYWGR